MNEFLAELSNERILLFVVFMMAVNGWIIFGDWEKKDGKGILKDDSN